MRISISVKVFLSFLLMLALSLAPGYWYLRRHLHEQSIRSVELDLSAHARLLADRLGTVPDDRLAVVARDIAGLIVDRVTLIAPDGRVIFESALPDAQLAHMENHLDRPEVRAALRTGAGTAIRFSDTKKEPYLYAARTLPAPGGAVRAVVRLSRTLAAVEGSLQGALRFLYHTAGVMASVIVLMNLFVALYGVRPLRRIQKAAQAYAQGDYTPALPEGRRDELGDLARSMAVLARRIQQEMVDHSADHALRRALVRSFPLPALLLSPDLERQEINAPFREALGIDPASEDVRIHALCETAEFTAARLTAVELGQPLSLLLPVPWRRVPLHALVCPLPAARGRLSWALFIEDRSDAGPGEWRDPYSRARQLGLQQLDALLDGLARRTETQAPLPASTLAARVAELRAAADVLRRTDTPPSTTVVPVDLSALLTRLVGEVGPLAEERRIELRAELPPSPLFIADALGFAERALRAALVRALKAVPEGGESPTLLSLRVHVDEATAQVELGGPLSGVPCADLDQLLGTLGGGAGPESEAAEAGGLVLRLRRA